MRLLALAPLLAVAMFATDATAFPHVVAQNETLAQIAERTYGRVDLEKLLVAANGLDEGAGVAIVPGMILEVPAPTHHRVTSGETWASLAAQFLGGEDRADVLAIANASEPWLAPADGQEILVPYNLRHVAGSNDSTLAIAYRYLGDRDEAWMLDKFNRLKGRKIVRGEVILVPIVNLPLTQAGAEEAARAGAVVRAQGLGRARDAQKRAEAELPALFTDVRSGRYVDAIGRGNRMLGYGELTSPQRAEIQARLTEAYIALDAVGLAEAACVAWREADPNFALDPIEHSPKIIRACTAPLRAPPAGSDAGAPRQSPADAGPPDAAASSGAPPRSPRPRGKP